MEFQEAASHARKMKRSFEVFSTLEEMLATAAKAGAALAETRVAKEKVSAEAEKQKLAVESLFKKKLALQEELTTLKAELAKYKKGDELKAFLAAQEVERTQVLAAIEADLAEARTAADEARVSFGEEVEVAKREAEVAKGQLEGLQKLHRELREKMQKGLG